MFYQLMEPLSYYICIWCPRRDVDVRTIVEDSTVDLLSEQGDVVFPNSDDRRGSILGLCRTQSMLRWLV